MKQDRVDQVPVFISLGTAIVIWCLMLIVAVANAQADPEANDPAYWCGDDGVKYEPVSTPYVVPEPEEGTTWTLLVLKAGTTNETIPNPTPGTAYSRSDGKDISHVILCWLTLPTSSTTSTTSFSTTTTTSSTTTTTSEPTTTTTTEASTTTTDPTTTSSSTVTTDPTTTSTSSAATTSTTTTTSTVPPTTTTIPTLPVTGIDVLGLAVLAAFLLGVGTLTLLAFGSRR